MYVITQAYVTTIAATAMTINSNVASIGDMAFLDFNMFLAKQLHLWCLGNAHIPYLTYMNSKSVLTICRCFFCCRKVLEKFSDNPANANTRASNWINSPRALESSARDFIGRPKL